MTWINASVGRVILVSLTFTIFCGFVDHNKKSSINVLLISGKNNHDWQTTTPAFRQILEEKGIFKVDITERPDSLKASVSKNYQVIASNWNSFPESTRQWGEVAEKAKVTQKLPHELSWAKQKKSLSWKEDSNSLALKNNDNVVWQFNYSKVEGKPYFHPLSMLDGNVLTELRPADHPWHRGIWFSWKFINGINYWEEDRSTGQSEGITELKSVTVKTYRNFAAEIQMKLAFHPSGNSDILKEDRLVTISALADNGSYFIYWESKFTAIADEVVLDRTPLLQEPNGQSWGGYAGFSARLNNQFQEVMAINDKGETEKLSGNQSRWMTFEMKKLNSELVAVTIFDHPENRNYPNKWYITADPQTPFYYFSPALLYDSKMVLKKGEVLNLKYMLLVNSGNPSVAQLQAHWDNFFNQNK